MGRVILHSDLNSFYASVECLHRPEIRGKPVAVSGNAEKRHGIILTRNEIAKKYGVKTGEAIWQAKQKCPELVTVPPDFPLYLRYSRLAREIYADYTDRVEPFGIDEAWLDLTGNPGRLGDGKAVAREISRRIYQEMGITASIGVSFNKIFAKLGSDYKKPNAITVFDEENYRQKVWPLPVGELLYVGPATKQKLHSRAVNTIGQLARMEPENLKAAFGKMGYMLHAFANGLDTTPVRRAGEAAAVKSIGNSCTAVRDLTCQEDVKMVLYVLAESVCARLREQGLCASTVEISVRDSGLYSFQRQAKLKRPTDITLEVIGAALELFQKNYRWAQPIRSLGVRAADFTSGAQPVQLDFYSSEALREKREKLDKTIDKLRNRFGAGSIRRGVVMQDTALTGFDPKGEHIIHPVGFF